MKRLSYLAAISATVFLTACQETPPAKPAAVSTPTASATPAAATPAAPAAAAPAAAAVPAAATTAAGEIIVDNGDPGFKGVGSWSSVSGDHNYKDEGVYAVATGPNETAATATWTPEIKTAGQYDVYEWHGEDPNSDHAQKAPFTVKFDGGTKLVPVDLRANTGKWNLLGTFKFAAGKDGSISLSSNADGNVLADAVKFVPHK